MPATQSINTPERAGLTRRFPLAANVTLFAGALWATDANGRLVPASDTAGLRVAGVGDEDATNGATAGAVSANVRHGVFRFANSAADAVDANDVGKIAYVEDDITVSETGGTHKVKAGRIVDVDSAGVWIDTTDALVVPSADTITAAADLAALKVALLAILQAQGLVK